MTARTVPPAGPATFAENFLRVAQRILSRCLAHHPAVDRRAAVLRLTCILGGNWIAVAETDDVDVIGEGKDLELDDSARLLVRASVSELDMGSKGTLMRRMDGRGSEQTGSEPPNFRVGLALTGDSWTLKTSAHSGGTGAVISQIDGTLLEAEALQAA